LAKNGAKNQSFFRKNHEEKSHQVIREGEGTKLAASKRKRKKKNLGKREEAHRPFLVPA